MLNSIHRCHAFRAVVCAVLTIFILNIFAPPANSQHMIPEGITPLSAPFTPMLLKGMELDKNDPLMFDFIVDTGNSGIKAGNGHDRSLQDETTRLVKYFLAGIAIPQNDLWVNLSPVEKNRIITDGFSQTDMGRDMLAQDYLLKRVTSSLLYPEGEAGKKFWNKIYSAAHEKLGISELPVDSFNKVWIIPENATVYRNGDRVFVANARLKVMLEEDYLANQVVGGRSQVVAKENPITYELGPKTSSELLKQAVSEIIIPILEKEVNEGQNFAQLRQIFHSLILGQLM